MEGRRASTREAVANELARALHLAIEEEWRRVPAPVRWAYQTGNGSYD